MIKKADLYPETIRRVRDVAADVGVSVEGWDPNDRYRNSRWCFGKAGAANLGFVWWKNLQEDSSGNIYFLNDAGHWADKCRRLGDTRAAAKADEFNSLINACYYGGNPLRVALVDGPADTTDVNADEKVTKRELDDADWYPHHRDPATGCVVVMRGIRQPIGFDPNAEYAASLSLSTSQPFVESSRESDGNLGADYPEDDATTTAGIPEPPERRTSITTAFPRDSDVVRTVKVRASDGKCECCGEQGFLTARGGYYLEVHHVIPLSCGGLDVEWNALAICPHDHKRAHFGAHRNELRGEMIRILSEHYPDKSVLLQGMANRMDSDAHSVEELESDVES
jgi:5-methylcytosine-specific restriction enzyme A